MRMQVAVCGPEAATEDETAAARRVGELLAERGVTVLCGGGGGVMAAVAAGVRARSGLVIGICPGDGADPGPAEVSASVVTNMGQARNAILVWSADAVIAIGGSWGTLSEVALGLRRGGIPVVVLGGWRILDAHGDPVPGPVDAGSPEEAVALALRAAGPAAPRAGTG
ncbi:LOG family protein [Micromonospora sp. C32]|uniref:SLOG cluster 4 domain-containing protein n=1 Tax=unclassified Micromonospora TaxID=2617518 RepID=UPI001B3812B3|nr:LOG family protein [Micromonospora sp. C32]MBQ1056791.1 LOG family protein [Micromonospora sp. C32]